MENSNLKSELLFSTKNTTKTNIDSKENKSDEEKKENSEEK